MKRVVIKIFFSSFLLFMGIINGMEKEIKLEKQVSTETLKTQEEILRRKKADQRQFTEEERKKEQKLIEEEKAIELKSQAIFAPDFLPLPKESTATLNQKERNLLKQYKKGIAEYNAIATQLEETIKVILADALKKGTIDALTHQDIIDRYIIEQLRNKILVNKPLLLSLIEKNEESLIALTNQINEEYFSSGNKEFAQQIDAVKTVIEKWTKELYDDYFKNLGLTLPLTEFAINKKIAEFQQAEQPGYADKIAALTKLKKLFTDPRPVKMSKNDTRELEKKLKTVGGLAKITPDSVFTFLVNDYLERNTKGTSIKKINEFNDEIAQLKGLLFNYSPKQITQLLTKQTENINKQFATLKELNPGLTITDQFAPLTGKETIERLQARVDQLEKLAHDPLITQNGPSDVYYKILSKNISTLQTVIALMKDRPTKEALPKGPAELPTLPGEIITLPPAQQEIIVAPEQRTLEQKWLAEYNKKQPPSNKAENLNFNVLFTLLQSPLRYGNDFPELHQLFLALPQETREKTLKNKIIEIGKKIEQIAPEIKKNFDMVLTGDETKDQIEQMKGRLQSAVKYKADKQSLNEQIKNLEIVMGLKAAMEQKENK